MADDRGVAAQVLLPHAVTDDDDEWRAGPVVTGLQRTPEIRTRAEDVEECRRRDDERQQLGVAGGARARVIRAAVGGEGGDALEDAGAFVNEIVLLAAPIVVHPEDADTVLVGVGKPLQQQGVDDAEERNRRADSEAEGEDDGGGECEPAAHLPNDMPHVGGEFAGKSSEHAVLRIVRASLVLRWDSAGRKMVDVLFARAHSRSFGGCAPSG